MLANKAGVGPTNPHCEHPHHQHHENGEALGVEVRILAHVVSRGLPILSWTAMQVHDPHIVFLSKCVSGLTHWCTDYNKARPHS